MAKTYDVKVKAPPREGFNGYWSAQKFWPAGQSSTTATVEGPQLRELLDDDRRGFLMVEDADTLRQQLDADAPPSDTQAGGAAPLLPPDELAVLEEFRRKKLADQQQASALKAKQDADAAAAAAAGKKGGK